MNKRIPIMRGCHTYRIPTPSRSRRGYAGLLGMLIVLVILFALVYQGYFSRNPATGVTQAQTYIDKSKDIACISDLQVVHGRLQDVMMTGNGQLPSINILKAKLGGAKCPGKGKYQIDPEGNVYCTVHSPAPDSVKAKLMDLQ